MLKPIVSFEMVGVDLVGPFKLSKNNNKYIFICIDHFTSCIEAIGLKGITAAE